MEKNDRLKGKIFRPLDFRSFIPFTDSFEITKDIPRKIPGSLHLAFAEIPQGPFVVVLCHLDIVPAQYHPTRTFSELLTGTSEAPYGHPVYNYHYLKVLESFDLSLDQFKALVRQASGKLGLLD
ncbi:hypothetical protein KKG46_03460 [Patescibacteria group bacterium]|nr:hypothetical protein [Patescibacteria group bacterium]